METHIEGNTTGMQRKGMEKTMDMNTMQMIIKRNKQKCKGTSQRWKERIYDSKER